MDSLNETANVPFVIYIAHQIQGILELTFDPSKPVESALSIVNVNTHAGKQPQWLTRYKDKIYGISRTAYPDEAAKDGGLFVFQQPDPRTIGKPLQLLQTQSSHGQGGVHVAVSPNGRILAAVNIEACSMSIYPLSPTGLIEPAIYSTQFTLDKPGPAVRGLQARSFPHEASFDPSSRYLLIPCRGEDRIRIYSLDSFPGITELPPLSLPPGTGPRHTHFHSTPDTTILYILGELNNTVSVYKVTYPTNSINPTVPTLNLTFTHVQTLSTLSATLPPTPPNRIQMASELALSSDARHLYISNRRCDPDPDSTSPNPTDTIAIFSLNHFPSSLENGSHLSFVELEDTQGNIPRHFALSPDAGNQYVAVGNEFSNDVVVFERDTSTGLFEGVRGRLRFGDFDGGGVWASRMGPGCILWK